MFMADARLTRSKIAPASCSLNASFHEPAGGAEKLSTVFGSTRHKSQCRSKSSFSLSVRRRVWLKQRKPLGIRSNGKKFDIGTSGFSAIVRGGRKVLVTIWLLFGH